jgi:PhnB protein
MSNSNFDLNPYLVYDGRCEEAIKFYENAIDAKVLMLVRFKECPDKNMVTPATEEKVMHARLAVGKGIMMLSDGHCTGESKFSGFSMSLTVLNEAEADRVFNALAAGGRIDMPLSKTFFSPRFGMVADKFGLSWMVIVGQG